MPTTEELLDLAPNVGQRQSTVRWDILDSALSSRTQGAFTPRSDTVPSVAVASEATIKRTLSAFRLNEIDQAAISPFADRIQPVWVLDNGAEFPLGVFLYGSIDRLRFDYGIEADVTCVDQTLIVDQPIIKGIGLAQGADIRDTIVEQLNIAGVPSYVVDPFSTAVGAPIAWPVGTSRLTVINDLAKMAGAFPLYFDNTGVGRVRQIPPLEDESPTLVYDFGGRIISGSMIESDDLLDAPNRYLVIDSSSVDVAVTGIYNIPASAPHSLVNRGFYVTKTVEVQGLNSPTQAAARAKAEYDADHQGYVWAQFSSPPDPRHDVFDAVSYLGTTYREQGWNLPLVEGSEMTHDLRRTFA